MSSIGTLAMQVIANAASFKATMDAVDERIRQSKQKAAEANSGGGGMVSGAGEVAQGILGNALATAAGPLAALQSVDKIVEAFRELGGEMLATANAARRLDVGTQTMWEWSEAAARTGIDVGELSTGVLRMQRTIAAAAHGSTEARAELESLGLDPVRLKTEGTAAAFRDLAVAVLAIPDKMERTRVEMEMFGRGGAMLESALRNIVATSEEGMQDSNNIFIDQFAQLKRNATGAWQSVKELGLVAIGMPAGMINGAIEDLKRLATAAGLYHDQVQENAAAVAEEMEASRSRQFWAGEEKYYLEEMQAENRDREKADGLIRRMGDSTRALAMGWSTSRAEVERLMDDLRDSGNLNNRDLNALEDRMRIVAGQAEAEQAIHAAREALKSPTDHLMDADRRIAEWLREGLTMEQAMLLARKARADYARAQGAAEKLPQGLEAGSAAGGRELIAIAAAAQEAESAIQTQAEQLTKLGVENAKMIAGQVPEGPAPQEQLPPIDEAYKAGVEALGHVMEQHATQQALTSGDALSPLNRMADQQADSNQTEAQQLEALNTIHDDLKQVIKAQPSYRPVIFE